MWKYIFVCYRTKTKPFPDADMVPKVVLEDKEQELLAKEETIQVIILFLKYKILCNNINRTCIYAQTSSIMISFSLVTVMSYIKNINVLL